MRLPLPTYVIRSAAYYGSTTYNEEDEDDSIGFIMAVLLGLNGYCAISEILRGLSADSSSGSSSGTWSGSSNGLAARGAPVAVCRVQVAVLASAREELQVGVSGGRVCECRGGGRGSYGRGRERG